MGDLSRALLNDAANDRRSGEERRVSDEPMPEFLGELDSRRFPRRADDWERKEAEDEAYEANVHLLLAEQCRQMASDTNNLDTRLAFLEMAEDYERMSKEIVRTTADFARIRANARAVCLGCNHSKVIPAATLEQWFEEPVELEVAGRKLRCPKCSAKGARLSPIPA